MTLRERVARVTAWWEGTRLARALARFSRAAGGVLTGGIAYAFLFSLAAALTLGFTGFVRLLGLPTDAVSIDLAGTVIFKGITVYGVLGRRMYDTWTQMSAFLKAGLIDVRPIITHRVPFERFEEGIAAIRSGQAGKVILTMEPA